MAWLLDTPLSTEGLDAYSHASEIIISELFVNNLYKFASVVIEYGNTIGNKFILTNMPEQYVHRFNIIDSDYDYLISRETYGQALVYDEIKTGLYQYLLEKNLIPGGTLT